MTYSMNSGQSSSRKEEPHPDVASEEIEHTTILRGIRKGIALQQTQEQEEEKRKK